jgi:Tol biopolymer transport system component
VLNADATETRLVVNSSLNASVCNVIGSAGSFSPDGSQVIFASFCGGVYAVDADGGAARLVLAPTREPRHFFGQQRSLRPDLSDPAFSPDGTQIAYVDGHGDWGNTLRVMNPDGTGVRVLVGYQDMGSYGCFMMGELAWSPNGTHIAFTCSGGIWVIGAEGSGCRSGDLNPDGLCAH